MERRLAAILAADVAGYSRLMSKDEGGTLAALRSHLDALLGPKIAEHRGHIVKFIGDGLLAEFASVVEAVECAAEIQQGMAARNAEVPGERRIDFRVGVNLGDVIAEEGDIYGDGVNIAARLQVLADPGHICVSHTVYDHVRSKVRLSFEDLGEQSLKNIEEPMHAYQIAVAGERRPTPRAAPTKGDAPSLGFHLPDRPSIAILPFRNLSGEPAQDYLADGLRLGIQATLVKLSGLFLINARAVNRYRERDVAAVQAGDELGVRYILDGAVQQSGQRIRATLQLTDVRADEIIWAERYDHPVDDILQVQDEIIDEVVSSLGPALLGERTGFSWSRDLPTREMRESFYLGISHLYKGTQSDNAAARRMFEELFRLKPDSEQGASNIALTHWLDGFFGWSASPAHSMEQAAVWARKALELGDLNGLGHTVLGNLELRAGRHDQALVYARKGVEIRSNCPLAHGQLAYVQNFCGDPQGAIKSARYALYLERVYPAWLINVLAIAYRDGGEVGLSIPAASEAARLNPQQIDARLILCSDYALLDRVEQAREFAQEIVSLDPAFSIARFGKTQPYKDAAALEHLIVALRKAGLPE